MADLVYYLIMCEILPDTVSYGLAFLVEGAVFLEVILQVNAFVVIGIGPFVSDVRRVR